MPFPLDVGGRSEVCGTDERFELDAESVVFILDVLYCFLEDRATPRHQAAGKGRERGRGTHSSSRFLPLLRPAASLFASRCRAFRSSAVSGRPMMGGVRSGRGSFCGGGEGS